jgi:LuxR family transcriptional activator of conjugal transfer of Ti plasmids
MQRGQEEDNSDPKTGKCWEVLHVDEWFDRLIEHAMFARDDITMREVLGKLVREAGFESYAYLTFHADKREAISNYRPEWKQLYFRRSYANIDPVIRRAWNQLEGFAWSNDAPRSTSQELRTFFEQAADFGIRSGITIPIRTGFSRIAMLTLASSKAGYAYSRTFSPVLAAAAVGQLHAKLSVLRALPTDQTMIRLKTVERIYLRWCAEGKRMRDIAVIENDTMSNVVFHLRNAKSALGATTLPQATALGTELKLI